MMEKKENGTMSEQESNEPNEHVVHVYDGIEELDNLLPKWWVILFYLAIAFGPVYMVYYHVIRPDKLPAAAHEQQMVRINKARAHREAAAALSSTGDNKIPEPSTDAAVLAKGEKLFMTNCFACHAMDGGGTVGPNLTDDYWLHGASFVDNLTTVKEGVIEKGMIPWKTMLKPTEIEAVTSYIWTFRGKTSAAPKAPEGKKVDEGGNVVDEKPRLAAGATS